MDGGHLANGPPYR